MHLELDRATTNAMSALQTADILPRLKTLEIHDFCQNSPNRQWDDDYYGLEYGSLIEPMLQWKQEPGAPMELFNFFLYTSRGGGSWAVRAPPAELIAEAGWGCMLESPMIGAPFWIPAQYDLPIYPCISTMR